MDLRTFASRVTSSGLALLVGILLNFGSGRLLSCEIGIIGSRMGYKSSRLPQHIFQIVRELVACDAKGKHNFEKTIAVYCH